MICGDSWMQAGQADYKWFCNSVSVCVPVQLDTAASAAKRSGKQILSFSHQVLPPGAPQYTRQRNGSQQGLKQRALLIWIIVSRCYVQEQVGWVDSGQGRKTIADESMHVRLFRLRCHFEMYLFEISQRYKFFCLELKDISIFFFKYLFYNAMLQWQASGNQDNYCYCLSI